MTTFQTYEQVGKKEDISEIITNISPRKTPFQQGIGREKVWNTLYQWQEDALRSVATNAQIEGADASFITVVPTVMRQNSTQILAEAVQVSGTTDAVSVYGRAKESAYQLAKSAAAVKRDLENALVATNQSQVVGNDALARTFAGYQQMLTVANNVVYMGVGNFLTETALLTALENCFINGAEPDTVSVTPANALTVAAFAKASGRFRNIVDQDAKAGRVVNMVDIYVSPFGEVKVILNRFQRAGNTLVYEDEKWVLTTLRPWFRQVLAMTGDSYKQMIIGEFGLKHKNFLASSCVVDNLASGF